MAKTVIQQQLDARRNPGGASAGIIYPKDPGQHYMSFRFYKYQRFTNNSERRNATGSIIMPIPSNLQEQFDAQFVQSEMGLIGNAKQTLGAMANPNVDLTGVFNAAKQELGQGYKEVEKAISAGNVKKIAGALFGLASTPQSIVAQVRGQIVNPHLVSSFTGTPLRGHSFNWRISPRSLEESQTLEKLIREVQKRMHPSKTGVFLEYPDEVDIEIVGTAANIFQYKTSVITNFTINRTAANTPAFFADVGYPTSYELNMSFMETEAWVREDFTDVSTSSTSTNTSNQTQVRP